MVRYTDDAYCHKPYCSCPPIFIPSMIQRRLSFLLALGIACCSFNVITSAETPIPKKVNFLKEEDKNAQAMDTLEKVKLGYDALMQAGYAADRERDYTTALNYFRQALNLRPDDSWANTAITNITNYSFDRYMQAGYKADNSRDYQLALKYFKKALEIKPGSFYAQKAVANISGYLSANAQESGNKKEDNGFNFLWILIGVIATIGIPGTILFFLFKNNQNVDLEKPMEDTLIANNSIQSIPSNTASNSRSSDLLTNETLVAPSSETKDSSKTPENQSKEIVTTNNQLPKLDIVPELISELEKSDRFKRQKTIWELAQRGDSRAMQPLVELMVKVDSQERGLILEAMTQIASRTLKPMNKAIMMSLEDDNPRVKQNAIRDLTRVYELMNQVTKRLSSVVEDSDEEVQKTAEWALKQLNQMPKVPLWQNHVMSENNHDISN